MAAPYNTSQGMTSVWLSFYTTCNGMYDTVLYANACAGFEWSYSIYDQPTDTNGYIGYLPSDNSIYVVFRGSESVPNWLTDFDATKTDYTAYPDCNCKVHQGFFIAEQAVIADIYTQVA